MARYIPENILDDILSKIDIAELISGYLPLKRAGRNFKALCPFHQEKTPSFMVNPQRQIYHCFGCGAGGNAFSFLMQYEHMEFPEAVEVLARRAGVVLPQDNSQSKDNNTISLIYKINEWASLYYQSLLNSPAGAVGRDYLHKRGIKQDMQSLFRLGLSLNKPDGLINYIREKHRQVSVALLEKVGLIISRQEGGYFDRFRNRIIFPIFDVKNRVVAFGGRLLGDDANLAKYINSPETPVYVKGRFLYGLNFSQEAIRQKDCAVVVEGYLDFLTPYQAGLKNIVASLGTSLTVEQIRLLKRYTHNVVMVYDSDQAGQAACLRSLDMFIEDQMNVKVAVLPPNFDPDLFVRQFGIEAFQEKIRTAWNLFDYKMNILNQAYDINTPEGKASLAQEMLASLNKFKDAILQSEYLKRLSQELNIREEALIIELKKAKEKKSYSSELYLKRSSPKVNPTERLLINLILRESDLIHYVSAELSPQDFQDERIARIFSQICDLASQGRNIQPHHLISSLDDEGSANLVSELMAIEDIPPEDINKIVSDCVSRIKKHRLNMQRQHLTNQIKMAQKACDVERLNHLVVEFQNLLRTR